MGLRTEVTKKIQPTMKECLKTGGNRYFFAIKTEFKIIGIKAINLQGTR
jgi:hypothetical protein